MWIKSKCVIRGTHNNSLMDNLKNWLSKYEKLSLWNNCSISPNYLTLFQNERTVWKSFPNISQFPLKMEKCNFATKCKTEESFTGWNVLFSVFQQHIHFEIVQWRKNKTNLFSILACFVQKNVLKAMIKKIYLITHKRIVTHTTSKLPSVLFPQLRLEYPQVLIACTHLLKICLLYAFILQ